jgi:hypothetical protein
LFAPGTILVVAFVVLRVLGLFSYPLLRIWGLRPRPHRALAFGAVYISCFAYVAAGFFIHAPFQSADISAWRCAIFAGIVEVLADYQRRASIFLK